MGEGGEICLEEILNSILTLLQIIPAAGAIIYVIIRIWSRTKIEMALENKLQKNVNNLIETFFIAIIIATSLTLISISIGELGDQIWKSIVTYLSMFFLVIGILAFILLCIIRFSLTIKNWSNKKKISRMIYRTVLFIIKKWNDKENISRMINTTFSVLFISVFMVNFGVFLVKQQEFNMDEYILFTLLFAALYFLLFGFMIDTQNQINIRNSEYYELQIIEENLNTTFKSLLLLYPLSKDKLIMIDKKDNKTDLHQLEVFYVYYINEKFFLKYKRRNY